ncbi:TPA: hypothetical protein ACQJMR_004093 [Raoultella ornithinolytica]
MTNNQLTREKVQWLHDAAEEAAAVGIKLTMNPSELLMFTSSLLAEMDTEPVAWLAIYHGEVYDDAIGITRSVVEAQADRFGWESALTEIIPLYRHVQPAPVVPDERAAFNAWNNEDNLPIAGVSAKNAAWLAWQARAELAGNSPVIPDGLIAAVNRLLDSDGSRGCYSAIRCGDAHDEIERLLATAPQELQGE